MLLCSFVFCRISVILAPNETSFVNPIYPPRQYIINVSHFTRIHICKSLERIWQKKNLLTASFWDVHKTYYRKAKTRRTTQRYFKLLSFFYERWIRCSIMTRLLKTYFWVQIMLSPFYILSKAKIMYNKMECD